MNLPPSNEWHTKLLKINHFSVNPCLPNIHQYYSLPPWWIIYNYPPKGRWIVEDIYRDAKRRGIYPPLFTDPEGDSCFSIYQIRWIKQRFFNFFFWNFRKTTRHFSLRSVNSHGYSELREPIKLLSTDLVNTK